MPDGLDPSDSGFDVFTLVPLVFGVFFLLIAAFIVFVIVRLVRNRKAYAQYEQDVLKLPGAILAAVERGDAQGAQLLQQQLLASQALLGRRGGAGVGGIGVGGVGAPGVLDLAPNMPGTVNGQPFGAADLNGDGVPGN